MRISLNLSDEYLVLVPCVVMPGAKRQRAVEEASPLSVVASAKNRSEVSVLCCLVPSPPFDTPRERVFQSPKALLMLPRSFSTSVTPR